MSNIHIKPETKIESVIFCLANSFIMVIGMMTLNLWIHGALNVATFCGGFLPIYAFAVALNFFIVVPLVQRVAVRFGLMRYIPFMMTACMAGTMTFVAPIIETGHVINLVQYLIAFPRNYIAAFLLQNMLAMPFAVRTLLYMKRAWRKNALCA